MSSNPGSAFGIAVNKGDSESIVDKMIAKGIGLYTFWISKDNADLPAEAKAKNSSCRGNISRFGNNGRNHSPSTIV